MTEEDRRNPRTLAGNHTPRPFSLIISFDSLLLLIGFAGFVSSLMLAMHIFNPWVSIAFSLIVCALYFRPSAPSISVFKRFYFGRTVVIAVIFAGLFAFVRLPAELDVLGGTDAGTYVNASKQIARTGSVFFSDSVRKNLYDFKNISLYDSLNHLEESSFKEGHHPMSGASHLPGIYIYKTGVYQYAFQSMPMHPIWMAIFAALLGDEFRVISLTFFSLLSLILLYAILKIRGGPNASSSARIAVLILALNHVHIYFSKIPYAETVAMTFLLSAVYGFMRFYMSVESERTDYRHLAVLALSFFSFGMTKIVFILYAPVFTFAMLLGERQFKNETQKRTFRLSMYMMTLVSVGMIFLTDKLSPVYMAHSLTSYINPVLAAVGRTGIHPYQSGIFWKASIFIVLLPVTFLFACAKARMSAGIVVEWLSVKSRLLIFLVMILGFFFAMRGEIAAMLDLTVDGAAVLPVFIHSYFYSYLHCLGPLVIFLVSGGDNEQLRYSAGVNLLLVYAMLFWFFVMDQNPYHLEGVRYMIPVMIPLTILSVAECLRSWHSSSARLNVVRITALALYASMTYSQFIKVSPQLVEKISHDSLMPVVRKIGTEDLLVFRDKLSAMKQWPHVQYKTALELYFGMNVMNAPFGYGLSAVREAAEHHKNVYILSPYKLADDGLNMISLIPFRYYSRPSKMGLGYPRKLHRRDLYLYRVLRYADGSEQVN